MKKFIFLFALVCCMTPAFAQSDDAPPHRDAANPQRDGGGRRNRQGGPGRDFMGPMIDRLKSQLDLDESQTEQFDEIVTKFREKTADGGGERGQQMRDLMRQIREARDAGDDAKVEELRGQMRELRGSGGGAGGPRPQFDAFFDEVRGILRDDQIDRMDEFRKQMRERMQNRPGNENRINVDDLPGQLKLDDQQLQSFNELKADLDQKLRELRPPAEMRDIMRQIREAERSGDDEKVAELRQQADQMRPDPTPAYDTFFAALNDELRDEQRTELTAFRKKTQKARGAEGGGQMRDLLRAVRKLDLTSDQREKLKDITRDAMTSERDKTGSVKPGDLKKKILAILTKDQATELESLLKQHRSDAADTPSSGVKPKQSAEDGATPPKAPKKPKK